MNKKYGYISAIFLAFGILLLGCNSSSAIKESIAAMPLPSPKLYLEKETLTLSLPGSSTTTSHYGDSIITNDWGFELHDEVLKETYTYSFVMASGGKSNVVVEIILKQGTQEHVLGDDSFTIESDQYQTYSGEITGSDVTFNSGDQLILRLTVSGGDFGHVTGAGSSISVLVNSTPLSAEIVNERIDALVWLATNNKDEFAPDAEIFVEFKNNLDNVVLSGDNASWLVGDMMTKSETPYLLEWVDNTFTVEKMTLEEFQARDHWSRVGIVFKLNP